MTGDRGLIVCFGELLLRLSPPRGEALLQSARLAAHFGGAEGNVAVALARLGRRSAMVSTVPDDAIGDAAIDSLRTAGVDVSRITRGPGRLGLYYFTPGVGLRAGAVVYDRAGSAFALQHEYDWLELLEGADWLHLSGIVPALGPEMAGVGLRAISAAHAAGVRVSFDCNFRATLWLRWCADAGPVLAEYIDGADLLFGNHRDLSLALARDLPGQTEDQRRDAARAAFERFPRLSAIASNDRELVAPDHHRLSARIDSREAGFAVPAIDVPGIVDRIGTGDAFAAGVLARLDDGHEAAATTGLRLAALKHGTVGDHSVATPRDLAAFPSGPDDVRR